MPLRRLQAEEEVPLRPPAVLEAVPLGAHCRAASNALRQRARSSSLASGSGGTVQPAALPRSKRRRFPPASAAGASLRAAAPVSSWASSWLAPALEGPVVPLAQKPSDAAHAEPVQAGPDDGRASKVQRTLLTGSDREPDPEEHTQLAPKWLS